MVLLQYEVLPIPQTSVRQPEDLLGLYRRMLANAIPGFVIRQSSLDEVASLVVPTGLIVPSNANGTPGNGGPHESRSLVTEEMADMGYHAHGIPDSGAPTTIIHHLSNVGTHMHTLGTFTPEYGTRVQGISAEARFDANTVASRSAEATMRSGRVDPRIFSGTVYRARIETGDIVVNRLTGASPNVHDFQTIAGPDEGSDRRSAVIRGYTAIDR